MIYSKQNKSKLKKLELKTNSLKFGKIGLKACYSAILNNKQIEAAWQTISRQIKKKGKLFIRISYNTLITSKPINARMGKGKGDFCFKGAKIAGGHVLFEICSVNKDLSILALKAGSFKLPIKTKIFSY